MPVSDSGSGMDFASSYRRQSNARSLQAVHLNQQHHRRTASFGLITAIIIAVIAHGSLYPFQFRIPATGDGPISALMRSGMARSGRGDLIANVLLYMPLGCFGVLSLPRCLRVRLLIVAVFGALLSASVELIQYFEAERVTSAADLYANLAGTILGGLGATLLSRPWRVPLTAVFSPKPIPLALIAAWTGYRLYPYVPTIDLHKYWNALKPIVLHPVLSFESLYSHTTIWLTIFALIGTLVGQRGAAMLSVLFCGFVLTARVLIVGTVLSVSEVAGAAAAICLLPLLHRLSSRQKAASLFALLGVTVLIGRLQPFEFAPMPRDFEWMPFLSLMRGSLAVNVMSLFEKSFLYGSLIYLFIEAGGRLPTAALVVSLTLFATSCTQMYLPDRSAEITDAVIALLLAIGFALTRETPRSA
ncbi:VanZ family protein [Reyranella sp.]|uniref:VanZ family protein n=1 Tax=Reyranella sp. TaxID=1929291 RepID=UPI003D1357D3